MSARESNRKQLIRWLSEREVILFGAGNYARQFYRDFCKHLNIVYCVSNDNREYALTIEGEIVCQVRRAESIALSDCQVIILCAARHREMEEQLRNMGYKYGLHYMDSQLIYLLFSEKKIAIFYGVCYMRAIYSCIIKSEAFSGEYKAFYWLDYWRMEPEEHELFLFLLPLCDLFIYNICVSLVKSQRNQSYLRRLSETCTRISVPLLVFNGYHPRTEGELGEGNPYSVVSRKTYYGPFIVPDCNVNHFIEEGMPCSEVLCRLSDPDYYSREWLEENYTREMKRLALAERLADIEIVDYIVKNHGKERLFLNETHIANPVIIELTKRILAKINFKDDLPVESLLAEQLLYTTEIPLYPSVIKHLRLEVYKGTPKYRLFTFGNKVDVTFEEYVARYYEYVLSMKKWINEGYFPK